MITIIRSLVFQIGMFIFTVPFTFFAICSIFLSPINRNKFISIWARSMLGWLKITCNLSFEVSGAKNIPKKTVCYFFKASIGMGNISIANNFPTPSLGTKKRIIVVAFFWLGISNDLSHSY